MSRRNINILFICLTISCGLSCRRINPTPNPVGEHEIMLGVGGVEAVKTKALMDRTDPNCDTDNAAIASTAGHYTTLSADGSITIEEACRYRPGEKGYGIGVWCDYITNDFRGVKHVVQDYFDFQDMDLVFKPDAALSKDAWWRIVRNNTVDRKYWTMGSRYIFRAFYPQSIPIHTTSNAESFLIPYVTHNQQEDLLVAVAEVSTAYPTQIRTTGNVDSEPSQNPGTAPDENGWMSYSLSTPIPFNFKHALAAVKFQFIYDYIVDSRIFSCWLVNTDREKGIATTGTLIFGNSRFSGSNQEETAHSLGIDHITWSNYQVKFDADDRFYDWANDEGVPLSTTAVEEYEDANGVTRQRATQYTIATAYTKPAGSVNTKGELFTNHNGWLLFLPQKMTNHVTLCFYAHSNKDATDYYEVPLPASFTTRKIVDGQEVVTTHDHYQPGYRYTYTIRISATEVRVASITLEPWQTLIASNEITFE